MAVVEPGGLLQLPQLRQPQPHPREAGPSGQEGGHPVQQRGHAALLRF